MWLGITNRNNSVTYVKSLARLRNSHQQSQGLAIQERTRDVSVIQMSRKVSRIMTDRGSGAEGGEDSPILIALHEARLQRLDIPVSFDRKELDQILRLY